MDINTYRSNRYVNGKYDDSVKKTLFDVLKFGKTNIYSFIIRTENQWAMIGNGFEM